MPEVVQCLMSKMSNLEAQTFGRLVALRVSGKDAKGYWLWECQCTCGAKVQVRSSSLKSGVTSSCGCLMRESVKERSLTHGYYGTPTHNSWSCMRARCTNPNQPGYENYGGRGITVCARWTQFENFLEDMGERPEGRTLDRKKTDLGYYKDNCTWSTAKEQALNRRNTRWFEHGGKTMGLGDWASLLGVPVHKLENRIRRQGLSFSAAISDLI